MKELWVKADSDSPWNSRRDLITTALESGADCVLVHGGEASKVTALGRIATAARDTDADGDTDADVFITDKDITDKDITDKAITNKDITVKSLKRKGRVAFYKEIKNKKDEEEIAAVGKHVDYVIIKATDWKVIPLENLIAGLSGKAKIIVEVKTKEEARLALETMEVGSDGVLLNSGAGEIKAVKKIINELSTRKLNLLTARVTRITPGNTGKNLLFDTCSLFNIGEGVLAGSGEGSSMFLVHSETERVPHLEKHPFRISIAGGTGGVGGDNRIRLPGGKTAKSSGLKKGDAILAVYFTGKSRLLIINEVRQEECKRVRIDAEFGCETENKKVSGNKEYEKKITVLLAETACLLDSKGNRIPVLELKPGDDVLVYVTA